MLAPGVAILLAMLSPPCVADAAREAFLAAEQAVAAGKVDTARDSMAQLEGYVLLPYLELALADARIDTTDHAQLARILTRHADVPGAAAVRRRWFERLAVEGRDAMLLEHFADDGHVPSACLAAQAEWRTGRLDQAWTRMAHLWRTGSSLPDVCDPVITAWRDAGQLDEALLWERLALAMEAGNLSLVRYLSRQMDPPSRALAEDWLRLRGAPRDLAVFARDMAPDDARRQRILVHVFARTARRDTALAREIWSALPRDDLPPALTATLRETLGEALADAREPDALEWLQGARSVSALTARAVEAIRLGRLDDVAAATAAMPPEEAGRERWRYWSARGLAARDAAGAAERMASLARERDFYGFMAADRMDMPYALGDIPIESTAAEQAAIAALPAALRSREWLALERPEEARREWLQMLASLDPSARRGAARLAHAWGWHEAAIRAAAAAEHWSDLDLRFPLAHAEGVRQAATRSGLPASRIYAVIRQESAFMRDIRSSAGALGLMQLMPATAREVARRARLPRPDSRSLLDPERNLLLGSLYMERLQRRYDGHLVLSTAAYNAGPGRVRQWQPRGGAMSSEAWIETIPFRETRRYVRSVLAYQIIYNQRLAEPALRISHMMPDVPPT